MGTRTTFILLVLFCLPFFAAWRLSGWMFVPAIAASVFIAMYLDRKGIL